MPFSLSGSGCNREDDDIDNNDNDLSYRNNNFQWRQQNTMRIE